MHTDILVDDVDLWHQNVEGQRSVEELLDANGGEKGTKEVSNNGPIRDCPGIQQQQQQQQQHSILPLSVSHAQTPTHSPLIRIERLQEAEPKDQLGQQQ